MNQPARRRGFHLLDLSAIVVGYGMASLLIRAFWPSGGQPPLAEAVVIAVFYSWLGLAMSGPLVLLVQHAPRTSAENESEDRDKKDERQVDDSPLSGPHTWAEMSWLIIGFYWIGLTVLVVPVRLSRAPLHDAALLGVFPIAAALVLRFLDRGARRMRRRAVLRARAIPDTPSWTHHAAVGLLLTWPIAWLALILLGKNLL